MLLLRELMDSNKKWQIFNFLFSSLRNESGQGTVEYAVVFAGFLCMVVTLGLMSDFVSGGLMVQHALICASHVIHNVDLQVFCDVFLY